MRFGLIGETLLERVALAAGLVPRPHLEGYAVAYSRALMAAADLGIFDALADESQTAGDVARSRQADARAMEKLLNLLVTMRYLRLEDSGRYGLTPMARRWLLEGNGRNVHDVVLMKFLEWRWLEGLEDFVRSGRPLDIHANMSTADWRLYQRGMRAQAGLLAPFFARRAPVPSHARTMLDVGGSHGLFSVALCRRHPRLNAVILDLPPAIEHATPLLKREGMGDRVTLRAGDALSDDLGSEEYDLILMFSLVHHFDEETNRRLVARAAKALRPGGRLLVGELMRANAPARGTMFDAFYDLYFALTSRSGLWSFAEIAGWQASAGLQPRKPFRLVPGQSLGLQVGERPRGRF